MSSPSNSTSKTIPPKKSGSIADRIAALQSAQMRSSGVNARPSHPIHNLSNATGSLRKRSGDEIASKIASLQSSSQSPIILFGMGPNRPPSLRSKQHSSDASASVTTGSLSEDTREICNITNMVQKGMTLSESSEKLSSKSSIRLLWVWNTDGNNNTKTPRALSKLNDFRFSTET